MFQSLLILLICLLTVQRSLTAKETNVFSASGELQQVEYAKKAAMKGSTVLCSKVENGEILLCIPTSAKPQMLVERRMVDKIAKISDDIWMAFAGVAGDARVALSHCRNFCREYYLAYGAQPPLRAVARQLGDLQHQATFQSGGRPLGVQVLLVGGDSDHDDFNAYISDPSGELSSLKAFAIGKDCDKFNKKLEDSWKEDMSLVETACMLMKMTGVEMEEDIDDANKHRSSTGTNSGSGGSDGSNNNNSLDKNNVSNSDSSDNSEREATATLDAKGKAASELTTDKEKKPAVDLYRFHLDPSRGRRMLSYYRSLQEMKDSIAPSPSGQ